MIIPNNFPIFQRESTTKSQDLIGPLSLGSKPLVAGHSAWHLWCSLWSHWCRAYHRFCHDTWRAKNLLSSYCCMRLLCFTIYVYVRSPSFESPIGFWNAHHGLFQHPLTAHHLVFRGLYLRTWFEGETALAISILVTAFSFSGICFPPMVAYFIAQHGWRCGRHASVSVGLSGRLFTVSSGLNDECNGMRWTVG